MNIEDSIINNRTIACEGIKITGRADFSKIQRLPEREWEQKARQGVPFDLYYQITGLARLDDGVVIAVQTNVPGGTSDAIVTLPIGLVETGTDGVERNLAVPVMSELGARAKLQVEPGKDSRVLDVAVPRDDGWVPPSEAIARLIPWNRNTGFQVSGTLSPKYSKTRDALGNISKNPVRIGAGRTPLWHLDMDEFLGLFDVPRVSFGTPVAAAPDAGGIGHTSRLPAWQAAKAEVAM